MDHPIIIGAFNASPNNIRYQCDIELRYEDAILNLDNPSYYTPIIAVNSPSPIGL